MALVGRPAIASKDATRTRTPIRKCYATIGTLNEFYDRLASDELVLEYIFFRFARYSEGAEINISFHRLRRTRLIILIAYKRSIV